MPVSSVVVHQGQVARAMVDQRMGKLGRIAGFTETADQDNGAVLYYRDGLTEIIDGFIYHRIVITDTCAGVIRA